MKQYILHLETATKVCSVALSLNGELVSLKETEEDGYSHGENLNLFIQEVLDEASISTADLSAVSMASGPGSYTGLRIGAATAKGLCYALDIPLIVVDALASMAEMARTEYPNEVLCPVIDARRMEVYNAIYNSAGERIKPISADVIEEESYADFRPLVCFGDGASKLQNIWSGKDVKFDFSIKCSAKGQVKLTFEKLQKEQFEDVAYWEPFYLKDFIAGKKKA